MRRPLVRLVMMSLVMVSACTGLVAAEFRVRSVRGDCRLEGEAAQVGAPVQAGLLAVSRGGEIVLASEELAIAVVGEGLVTVGTGGAYNTVRILHGRVELAGDIDRWRVTVAPFTLAIRGEAIAVGRSQAGALELTIGRGEVALRDHRAEGLPGRSLAAQNGATWRAEARAGGLTTFSYFEPADAVLRRFSELAAVIDRAILWSPWERGVLERPLVSGER